MAYQKMSGKAEKIKEITLPKAMMSENGDQFTVDGRKPGSTCKLHPVSWSSAETTPAPDERESEHDGKWLYMEQ